MTSPLTPRERVPYSAIVDRPPLALPGGARMIVWTIVNVEDWGIERTMPRTVLSPPMGAPLLPDLPNWAWHEYGMRVGFWRLFDCLQEVGVTPMHKVEDQRAAIRDTIDAIRAFSGKAPRGWESPGLTETFDTIDHLAEAGIEYVADWVLDDQPVYIATAHGPVLSVPYTVEVNDIAIMVVQHHSSDEMLRRGRDHFDRLYQDSASAVRVMAISVHPYISGVPHRIGYLEQLYRHVLGKPGVVHWTGEQILDWFRTQTTPQVRV